MSAAEINNATNAILRLVQREKYPEAYELLGKGRPLPHKNGLADLRPAWDARDRLIRVTGRIELAIRDREEEPPILLPASHRIVDNLIYEAHHRLKHAGVRTTLSEVRAQYWIARGRQQVKRILGKCVRCQHFNKRHLDQVPASLPKQDSTSKSIRSCRFGFRRTAERSGDQADRVNGPAGRPSSADPTDNKGL